MSDCIRKKEEMFDSLIKIIKSKRFKRKLAKINDNFFNLKQEIHIRNLLVELFNKKLKKEGERAIAEYRELQNETDKNIRIDLALSNRKEVALIELKYHFANDPQIKKNLLKTTFQKERNVITLYQLSVMAIKIYEKLMKIFGILKLYLQEDILIILNGKIYLKNNFKLQIIIMKP